MEGEEETHDENPVNPETESGSVEGVTQPDSERADESERVGVEEESSLINGPDTDQKESEVSEDVQKTELDGETLESSVVAMENDVDESVVENITTEESVKNETVEEEGKKDDKESNIKEEAQEGDGGGIKEEVQEGDSGGITEEVQEGDGGGITEEVQEGDGEGITEEVQEGDGEGITEEVQEGDGGGITEEVQEVERDENITEIDPKQEGELITDGSQETKTETDEKHQLESEEEDRKQREATGEGQGYEEEPKLPNSPRATTEVTESGQPETNTSGKRPTKTSISIDSESWKQKMLGSLPPLITNGKRLAIKEHVWNYKRAPGYVRDVVTGTCAPCKNQHNVNRYAGPYRKQSKENRDMLQHKLMNERDVNWLNPNPAVTVPMRPKHWKRMTWLPPKRSKGAEWLEQSEREQARKETAKANKLGYETLLGNLVYINIPGANDLNRSWKHFLDKDPMAWGFPYSRGTTERPSRPLPSPYLVHQLKENLWKYPKNKFLHSLNE